MKCKATLPDGKSKANTSVVWKEGITHYANKGEVVSCTNTAIHFYEHPLLAVFFAPIHTYDSKFILWEYEPVGKIETDGCKSWSIGGTTIRQIDIPILTTEQRVSIAIQAALLIYYNPSFVVWAKSWLDGSDRSTRSATYAEIDVARAAITVRALSVVKAAITKRDVKAVIAKRDVKAAIAECDAASAASAAARAVSAKRDAEKIVRAAISVANAADSVASTTKSKIIKKAFLNAGFNLD